MIPNVFIVWREYSMHYVTNKWTNVDEPAPNGLGISRAAPLDRKITWAESRFQKRPDLGAAQRRRLQPPMPTCRILVRQKQPCPSPPRLQCSRARSRDPNTHWSE